MKIYPIRKLIDGFKLGKLYRGKKYIAVPNKYFLGQEAVIVRSKETDEEMIVYRDQTPEAKGKVLEDQFGRVKGYRLFYYKWNPHAQKLL